MDSGSSSCVTCCCRIDRSHQNGDNHCVHRCSISSYFFLALCWISKLFSGMDGTLISMWLECLKPAYGLNLEESGGQQSALDENCWHWKDSQGALPAIITRHVDDIAVATEVLGLCIIHHKVLAKNMSWISNSYLCLFFPGANTTVLLSGPFLFRSSAVSSTSMGCSRGISGRSSCLEDLLVILAGS